MFQLEHLTKAAIGDGVEDGNLGRVTARSGILCERVTGGDDDMDPDAALWSIAVVLKLESVNMQRLLGVGVINSGRSKRGQPEAGSLEIHKSLESSRWLGSLVECQSRRRVSKTNPDVPLCS